MTLEETRSKNLRSLAEITPEQRKEFTRRMVEKKALKREKKAQFAIGANFACDVLSKKKTVKIDGKAVKKTVYELAQERCIEMLMDRDNPRLALEMLKFLNELSVGNPKLYTQININNVPNENTPPQTAEERRKEFRKLMGIKEEAETVQYEVKDADS